LIERKLALVVLVKPPLLFPGQGLVFLRQRFQAAVGQQVFSQVCLFTQTVFYLLEMGISAAWTALCSNAASIAARSKSSPSLRAVIGFVLSGVR
jgi:hypothetical protein